jgi:uncharacterized protein
MAFECFQCGDCCTQMGLVHQVKEEYGSYHFLISNPYTRVEMQVTVDPDKHVLFDDRSIFEKFPDACPFFRHKPGTGLAYCTVHCNRPEICRDYQCWRLLIQNPRGRPVGKIRYIRTLISDDPLLNRLWKISVEDLDDPDDRRWEAAMIRILVKSGYSVRM